VSYHSADHAFWRWLELGEALASPSSIGAVERKLYPLACPDCDCRIIRTSRRGNYVCADCDRLWPEHIIQELPNEVDSSPRACSYLDDLLAERSSLAIALFGRGRAPLGKQQARAYFQLYLLEGRRRNVEGLPWSYYEAAMEGRRRWPRTEKHWTEKIVRTFVARAREKLEQRLDRKGLLEAA
jgi:hypothetical protein